MRGTATRLSALAAPSAALAMSLAAVAVSFVTLGPVAATALAAAPRARVADVPELPSRAAVRGPLAPSRSIPLTVSLSGRDPLGLQSLAVAVATPGSAHYRRYLSVSAFARRFGATPAQIAAVTRLLRRDGLDVDRVDANHLTLSVRGTAARVERAFATRLARVRMASGRTAFAPRTTPTLPTSVAADIDGVIGLDSLYVPEQEDQTRALETQSPRGRALALARAGAAATPALSAAAAARGHVATGGPQPCASAQRAQLAFSRQLHGLGGYTADEIATAYDFDPLYGAGDSGAGQTVAVYELEGLKTRDVARFQACYGTAAPVTVHVVNRPASTATDEESALDVEQIISLAPGVRISVYEGGRTAAGSLHLYSRIISSDVAKTITSSWGGCETEATDDRRILTLVRDEDRLFQEAAVQGQSVIVASGDTGSSSCYQLDRHDRALSVADPASQPFVTSVGGTSLYADGAHGATTWDPNTPGEPAPRQSVWNDGIARLSGTAMAAASGGGISRLWRMPSYQRHARRRLRVVSSLSSSRPCDSSRPCREVPDVSADGDPMTGYLAYVTGPSLFGHASQWALEAGTSAAAPLWAALTALTDASPTCRGTTVGFENPALYRLAGRRGYLTDIHRASPFGAHLATNDAIGAHPALYPVARGYDMTTGLGTPVAAAVVPGLCGLRAPVYDVALAGPRARRAFVGAEVVLHVRGRDSGHLPLVYRAKGLPPGLRISRRGVISGRARRAGRYRVTVTARDHATNTARVAFRLRVLLPFPELAAVGLVGVAARHPELGFGLTRGRSAPRLSAVTVGLPRGLSVGRHGRGIRVRSGRRRVRFAFHRRRGALTIRFHRSQASVHVSLGRGTLFASRGLAAAARGRHPGRVRVRVSVTDARHRTRRFTVRLRLRR